MVIFYQSYCRYLTIIFPFFKVSLKNFQKNLQIICFQFGEKYVISCLLSIVAGGFVSVCFL